MPPVRRSRRLRAARTVVEVVIDRPPSRPRVQKTANIAAAAAETARGWTARITLCATQAYDAGRGRIDWEAVAAELGLPLIGCLHLFDAASAAIPVRSLPDIVDWSHRDICALRGFVAKHFEALAGKSWGLMGVYMNVDYADCINAYRRLGPDKMTAGMHESIRKCHADGMSWRDIHETFPMFPCPDALRGVCRVYESRQRRGPNPNSRKTPWTTVESSLVRELTAKHYIPRHLGAAVNAVAREFPEMPRKKVKDKVSNILNDRRMAGVKADAGRRLAECPPGEFVPNNQATGKAVPWRDSDVVKLRSMVESAGDAPVDWVAISSELRRNIDSCKQKYQCICRQRAAGSRLDHADLVNSEVRKQNRPGSSIDWVRVSWAVGLSELDCLELCQVDDGKARWTYDPDTFSQETADRMNAFIAENYPPPATPNYRAVSNYMWLNMADCVHMERLLRGVFDCTKEAKAKVIKLRKQGMQFDEIARQLSPNLTGKAVCDLHARASGNRPYVPLSADQTRRIRDIVDRNAGKVRYLEIVRLAREALNDTRRGVNPASTVASYASSHPYYKAQLEGLDKTQIVDDIVSGATTAVKKARELDIPSALLVDLVKKRQSTMFTSVWTEQEEAQLLAALRVCTSTNKWAAVSQIVGTKSARQCQIKRGNMRQRGGLVAGASALFGKP